MKKADARWARPTCLSRVNNDYFNDRYFNILIKCLILQLRVIKDKSNIFHARSIPRSTFFAKLPRFFLDDRSPAGGNRDSKLSSRSISRYLPSRSEYRYRPRRARTARPLPHLFVRLWPVLEARQLSASSAIQIILARV